jgi:hypothetical protein
MQAAARSYRLNQTHEHCKVIYLYHEGTMEQTAVQLMSRKQRAAKLLTGDIGLTGLDALTEGEGGLEEALLDAIAGDDALIDPRELFRAGGAQGEIDAEDAVYWNVEVAAAEPAGVDPLIETALQLGGVLVETQPPAANGSRTQSRVLEAVSAYLDSVHILTDPARFARLQARLIQALEGGVENDDGTRQVVGLCDPDWLPDHEARLTSWVRSWLKRERLVFAGHEDEVAAEIVRRAKIALDIIPLTIVSRETRRRRQVDLAASPDDAPPTAPDHPFRRDDAADRQPVQLALF